MEPACGWLGLGYCYGADQASTYALEAMSELYFGRVHKQASNERAATITYNKPMRKMSSQLSKSDAADDLSLITNAMLMTCYEVSISTVMQALADYFSLSSRTWNR